MSNYPMFYENSVPTNIAQLEYIAAKFNISITDVDIWQRAKCYIEPPHLGNVYLQLLFSWLQYELSEKYSNLEIDYFINGTDTHFYINGVEIWTEKQFNELIQSQN